MKMVIMGFLLGVQLANANDLNTLINGEHVEKNTSGEVVAKKNYKNGKLHGKCERFEKGKIAQTDVYVEGSLQTSKYYHDNEKPRLVVERNLKNEDEKTETKYRKDGSIYTKDVRKSGDDKILEVYYTNGKVARRWTSSKDKTEVELFLMDGTKVVKSIPSPNLSDEPGVLEEVVYNDWNGLEMIRIAKPKKVKENIVLIKIPESLCAPCQSRGRSKFVPAVVVPSVDEYNIECYIVDPSDERCLIERVSDKSLLYDDGQGVVFQANAK